MSAQSPRRAQKQNDVPEDGARSRAPDAGAAKPVTKPSSAQRAATSNRRRANDGQGLKSQIEPRWKVMTPVFAAAIVISAITSQVMPRPLTIVMLVLALALPALTRQVARFERKYLKIEGQRRVLALSFVALPMALFGMALARWTYHANGDWQDTLGLLVISSTVAVIILNRRVSSVTASQMGMWCAVAAIAGTNATYFALLLGGLAGTVAARREAESEARHEHEARERRRSQLRAEEILNDFEQTGQGWFWETDRRGNLIYVSATVGDLLGCDVSSLQGRPFSELFIPDPQGQESERTLAFHLSARSAFTELALRAATKSDERWWSVNGRPIYDNFGNFLGFRGSGNDLTERRRSAENATRLAHYDSLTGLSNRLQMAQTLEKILVAPNLEHRACAVFLLDLDRFKQVNDTMGHPAGDYLLTQVASRLERTIGQHGRVGRLGGDEFQVILPGRHRREDLAMLAARVIRDLSEPYSIDGHRVMIGASVGIAVSPDDGVSSEDIIRNADLALYAAKDGGRGRHHFYAADLHSDAEERRQLEQDLRDAIATGGFQLHYQPVVHTSTERITGFEALLRWHHPVRGWMSPAKFIPVAEDSGLIAQIGEWVLRQACDDLAKWPEAVRVAVNVSTLQFANPALPAIITNALATAQVNPARLELEITESVFLGDDDGTDAMFAALKRVGVRLALDDFGTGYSSLGYLKKAPFDKIKIDQSFVRGATINGSRNGAIIASIVSLAEALGMETTAEGVETLDELDLVRMLGCSHVQGYIYAKPLDFEAACDQLSQGTTAIAKGPRAARSTRHTMLRKVVLDHNGQQYHGTIRNISATGAMVEGLWNVPPGTIFRIMLNEGGLVTATARWCQEDRMGVEFAVPLELDAGRIAMLAQGPGSTPRSALRRDAAAA